MDSKHFDLFLRKEFSISGFEEDGTYITDEVTDSLVYVVSSEYFCRVLAQKQYELSNHLGNVLATVLDRRTGVFDEVEDTLMYYVADVVSATLYYPFGLAMQKYSNPEFAYKYKHQGQESDDEVYGEGAAYFYTYRMSDSRLGRFWRPDPLESNFPWNSPYAYSENRVIDGIELEGLEVILVNPNTNPKDVIIYEGAKTITDRSAIHIIAHGSQRGISNDKSGTRIQYSYQFTSVLKMSDQYDNQVKSGSMCVVLHACRTGRPITNKDGITSPPFAQRMSKDLGITVIAPDERDYFTRSGEVGPQYTKHTDNTNRDYLPGTPKENRGKSTGKYANWLIYKEGVLIGVYDGNWSPNANPTWLDDFLYKKDLSFSVNVNQHSTLNLRSGAGTTFDSIDKLSNGTKITPTGNVSNGWMEVKTEDGKTGWVDSKHTTAEY